MRAYCSLHNSIDVSLDLCAEGDSFDLAIGTQDVWTTRPTLEFRKDGRLLTWSVGLSESNLLGLGKGVGLTLGESELRSYLSCWYRDPQFIGRGILLTVAIQAGDEIEAQALGLIRPLDRAVTPWGIQLEAKNYSGLFLDRRGGLDGPEWESDRWLVSMATGPRLVGTKKTALWLKPAVYLTSERYEPPADSSAGQASDLPALQRREIRAVGVEFDLLHERYSQRSGINTFFRCEDFNLGTELRLRVGYSPRSFGASEDGFFFLLQGLQGLPMGSRQFLLGSVWGMGQFIDERFEDVRFRSALWYYNNLTRRQTLATRLRCDLGVRLAPQAVFSMGARSGLRGFETFRFWGERVIVLNIEDRVALMENLMGLLTIGVVCFVDGGLAWEAGHHGEARPRIGTGIGLRLLGSRGRGALVTRVDIGFPVIGADGDSGPVLSIGAGQMF